MSIEHPDSQPPRRVKLSQTDASSKDGRDFIDKHLFDARTIFVVGEISSELAHDVCARLIALSNSNPDIPINVFVSSPGGHVESGDMIHDTIQFVRAPVRMIGSGWVASAGALIYVAVPKERRFTLPNTRFLLHQPSGGTAGKVSDIEIQAREITAMRIRLNKIFAEATGQPLDRIAADTDRDFWLSADDAMDYGLVGKKIRSIGDLPTR